MSGVIASAGAGASACELKSHLDAVIKAIDSYRTHDMCEYVNFVGDQFALAGALRGRVYALGVYEKTQAQVMACAAAHLGEPARTLSYTFAPAEVLCMVARLRDGAEAQLRAALDVNARARAALEREHARLTAARLRFHSL